MGLRPQVMARDMNSEWNDSELQLPALKGATIMADLAQSPLAGPARGELNWNPSTSIIRHLNYAPVAAWLRGTAVAETSRLQALLPPDDQQIKFFHSIKEMPNIPQLFVWSYDAQSFFWSRSKAFRICVLCLFAFHNYWLYLRRIIKKCESSDEGNIKSKICFWWTKLWTNFAKILLVLSSKKLRF